MVGFQYPGRGVWVDWFMFVVLCFFVVLGCVLIVFWFGVGEYVEVGGAL